MKSGSPGRPITCYAIAGLGGTPDLFQKLTFPPWIKLQPITWIPNRPKETLAEYAHRLLPQVNPEKSFILLGYSFGAAIAIEMAKHCTPVLTVIVSGVKTERELPYYLGRAELFGAYGMSVFMHDLWMPLLRIGARIAFSTNDPEALDMLTNLIRNADPKFYQWGLRALMAWDNSIVPDNTLHIHGNKDRVLPIKNVNADILIPGGGHLILFTHGKLIADAVITRLTSAPTPSKANR